MAAQEAGKIYPPLIQWLGQHELHWDQLMLALPKALKPRHQPDILFLHLGENDLVTCSAVKLLDNLTQATSIIKHLIHRTRLIWANMLPRHVWCGANSSKAINVA